MRSLEARWFMPGELDAAVAGWFARFPAGSQSREDTYPGAPGAAWNGGKNGPSPATRPARAALNLPGWRPVRKLIRQFPAASGQTAAGTWGLGGGPRCQVELTEVRAGGQAWWTLGFEATGPDSLLRAELEAAAALVFAQPLPGGLELAIDHCQSYAQWLAASHVHQPARSLKALGSHERVGESIDARQVEARSAVRWWLANRSTN